MAGESAKGGGNPDKLPESDCKHLSQAQPLALQVAKGEDCRNLILDEKSGSVHNGGGRGHH